jgi:hypothetical protein
MAESFGGEFTMVEVTTDDWSAAHHLWIAAAKPSQALTLVCGLSRYLAHIAELARWFV